MYIQGTGDTIGAALDYVTRTISFYKNGMSQGVAFINVTEDVLFATVGCRTPGEELDANFGDREYSVDYEEMHRCAVQRTMAAIMCTSLAPSPTLEDNNNDNNSKKNGSTSSGDKNDDKDNDIDNDKEKSCSNNDDSDGEVALKIAFSTTSWLEMFTKANAYTNECTTTTTTTTTNDNDNVMDHDGTKPPLSDEEEKKKKSRKQMESTTKNRVAALSMCHSNLIDVDSFLECDHGDKLELYYVIQHLIHHGYTDTAMALVKEAFNEKKDNNNISINAHVDEGTSSEHRDTMEVGQKEPEWKSFIDEDVMSRSAKRYHAMQCILKGDVETATQVSEQLCPGIITRNEGMHIYIYIYINESRIPESFY